MLFSMWKGMKEGIRYVCLYLPDMYLKDLRKTDINSHYV